MASGDLTVVENVMVGCFMRTRSSSQAKARAEQILKDFKLLDLSDYLLSELPVAAQKRGHDGNGCGCGSQNVAPG